MKELMKITREIENALYTIREADNRMKAIRDKILFYEANFPEIAKQKREAYNSHLQAKIRLTKFVNKKAKELAIITEIVNFKLMRNENGN